MHERVQTGRRTSLEQGVSIGEAARALEVNPCDHVVYPQYRQAHGAPYLSPLQDQASAGATMWVVVTFAHMAAALVITTHLIAARRPETL